jgi:hypothetical protein
MTKSKAQSPKQRIKGKIPNPTLAGHALGNWSLGLGWSLGFGNWDFFHE